MSRTIKLGVVKLLTLREASWRILSSIIRRLILVEALWHIHLAMAKWKPKNTRLLGIATHYKILKSSNSLVSKGLTKIRDRTVIALRTDEIEALAG